MPSRAHDELEEFFRATNALENKELKFLGWRGPNHAAKTIKRLASRVCPIRDGRERNGHRPFLFELLMAFRSTNVQGTAPAGRVVAVSIDGKHRFSKTPRLSVALIAGQGIEGDAHQGPLVKHRYLARRYPRAPNLRQVHLIPSETLEAVRAAGYNIGPGELGENITTSGLDLENLPVDAEIRLGASARIRLTGLRTPCVLIDRFPPGLKGRLMCEGPHPPFKAGVMSIVIESGEVVTGDSVWTFLPTAPHRPLPPL